LILSFIFFLLLLPLVFWIDFFLWFAKWCTFHHSGHFFVCTSWQLSSCLLASRLNGRLLFFVEFFHCCFWHLYSPCWCWQSPWWFQLSSFPYYCCCSYDWLLLATLVARVVFVTFATHILLSTIVNLVTCLLFATLGGVLFNH